MSEAHAFNTPQLHHLSTSSSMRQTVSSTTTFMSSNDEPSDVESSYEPEEDDEEEDDGPIPYSERKSTDSSTTTKDSGSSSNMNPKTALQQLLALGARTGRGEYATKEDKSTALDLIQVLEENNPTSLNEYGDKVYGRWELVYASTQLFRSSPFFMAGRAVCETQEQADQYNWFCDMHRKALAISQIGTVRQIISPSRMISEFEVKVGAIPFLRKFTPFAYSGGLPVVIEGAIVSSADLDTTEQGDAFELYMDTVEIKGSNIPGLRQLLDMDNVKLESRRLSKLLEDNIASYSAPRPIFETTYVDDNIRIGRDQDGNAFVYTKISNTMDPTDYDSVTSDLGVARLLEGFNDSVTKFYL